MALQWKGCFGSGCHSKTKNEAPEPVSLPSLGGLQVSTLPETEIPVTQSQPESGSCECKTMPSFKPGRLTAVAVLLGIGLVYNYLQK